MPVPPPSGVPSPRVAAAALRFVEELSRERGVRALLQAAHEVLGFPLHLLDPAFRLVARVGGESLTDPRWVEYLETGGISDHQVAALRKSGFVAGLRKVRRPAVDPGSGGQPDVIACDVVAGGQLLGRLGVWATGGYGPDDVEIVLQLSRVLAVELQRRDSSGAAGRGDWILDRLLSDPPLTPAEVPRLVERLDLDLQGPLRVVVLTHASDPDPNGALPAFLLDRATSAFAAALGTIRSGQVVLLTSDNAVPADFLEKHDLRCGVSRPLTPLSEAGEGYRQASAALRLGPTGCRQVFYEAVFPLDLVALCAASVSAERLCYPPVRRLRDYDRTWGTEYLPTLAVWFRHAGNGAGTARDLGIHYNTLKYRLQVLQDVMGVDLAAPGERLRVEFSLWALGVGDLTLSVN